MSKRRPGRPRKFVPREKDGRPQRTRTLEQIQAAEQAARLAEQSTVLAQPHRRDANDPRSTLLITALGRFADAAGLPKELTQAGIDYHEIWRRLLAFSDAPGAIKEPREYPPDCDPEEAEARRGRALMDVRRLFLDISHGAARRDPAGFTAARHLVIDDMDAPREMWGAARAGLYALALELGLIASPRVPSTVDNADIRSSTSARSLEKIT